MRHLWASVHVHRVTGNSPEGNLVAATRRRATRPALEAGDGGAGGPVQAVSHQVTGVLGVVSQIV